MKTTASGYEIIQELAVGKTVYIIGHKEKAVQPYVTWLYDSETESCSWGHCFQDLLSAQKDLIKRAAKEIDRIEALSECPYREAR